jgi:hypothetical protein
MFSVHTKLGPAINFPDNAEWEVEPETGQLRVYVDEVDVALFADGGWFAVTRPLPETEEPAAEEELEDDDYDVDEV